MCGITGFVNFEGHNRDRSAIVLKKMTDTLLHRGPDQGGYYVDSFAALGHRRLSIIDLSNGQQPMAALDGQIQIIFNGEIYNFLDIKADLESKGYHFKTRCDTEVILLGYIEWGEQFVTKLNGMFAFAIWDRRIQRLFLARDRVGKKPLYYYYDGQTFAFASELKALRAGEFCSSVIDLEALDCYLSFGYIPAPKTIYHNIKKLSAACCLLVSDKACSEQRYWQLSFTNPVMRSLDEAADEFETLLDNAVKIRLMSEVPLGVFLSGGLDSTLVASSMARAMNTPIITNSIGFEDRNFSELPLARSVAKHIHSDHHEFVVIPQVIDILEEIAWHFDEPFADSSAVPTWYVCQMARENVTVALSGDGGDEGFGGYTFRYIPHVFEAGIRSVLPTIFRRAFFGLLSIVWPSRVHLPKWFRMKTIFENLAVSDAEAFYQDLIWLRGDTRVSLYSHDFIESLSGFTPLQMVYPLYSGSNAPDALGRSQYTDIHFYMTDDVLVKVDRMSMAHSLEVRCPLLDYRILEFAATLCKKHKINARQGKLVLRTVAGRRLPHEILHQPKRGFSIPASRWLKEELRPLIEDTVFGRQWFLEDLLDIKKTRIIWNEHLKGVHDHSVFLWALMMLGLWEKSCLSV